MTQLFMRNYQTEDDFWRIRNFLRQVFLLNDRRAISWPVVRWDYWRWHGIKNLGDGSLETDVFIWETGHGQIAAVLNRENDGQAFLHVHPSYKIDELENQMIMQAEQSLKAPSRKGGKALWVWSDSMDTLRHGILEKRGYSLVPAEGEHQWRLELDLPIPQVSIKKGYSIRALGDENEIPSRSWASWRAFHPSEPDEKYEGWSWYRNIQSAPLYRRDLDLVAVDPTGNVVAFTTLWYDDVSRCGFFEPVGTVPEHQRLGLASALMVEGMRRMKVLGATRAMVGGEASHANTFYQSIFGPEHDLSQPWEKRWAE